MATSVCPFKHAVRSGVPSNWSRKSTAAPFSSMAETASAWPRLAATCNGLCPHRSTACNEALAVMSALATAALAASCSGVLPAASCKQTDAPAAMRVFVTDLNPVDLGSFPGANGTGKGPQSKAAASISSYPCDAASCKADRPDASCFVFKIF